jgi:hypothetical protein
VARSGDRACESGPARRSLKDMWYPENPATYWDEKDSREARATQWAARYAAEGRGRPPFSRVQEVLTGALGGGLLMMIGLPRIRQVRSVYAAPQPLNDAADSSHRPGSCNFRDPDANSVSVCYSDPKNYVRTAP